MKRLTLVLAVLALVAAPSMGQGISGTAHDLSSNGPNDTYATDSSQLCVYCHTPHNATFDVPLWNHQVDTDGTTPALVRHPAHVRHGWRLVSHFGHLC